MKKKIIIGAIAIVVIAFIAAVLYKPTPAAAEENKFFNNVAVGTLFDQENMEKSNTGTLYAMPYIEFTTIGGIDAMIGYNTNQSDSSSSPDYKTLVVSKDFEIDGGIDLTLGYEHRRDNAGTDNGHYRSNYTLDIKKKF
jgi:hypothetical protein